MGFNDEARVATERAAGHVDVLAGDDTAYLRRLVDEAERDDMNARAD